MMAMLERFVVYTSESWLFKFYSYSIVINMQYWIMSNNIDCDYNIVVWNLEQFQYWSTPFKQYDEGNAFISKL